MTSSTGRTPTRKRTAATARVDRNRSLRFARPRGAISRGFTLLEMLLVVGILLGLAALAWPNYSRMIADRRLLAEAELLRNAIRTARRQAMVDGAVYVLELDPSGERYRFRPDKADRKSPAKATAPSEDEDAPAWRLETSTTPGLFLDTEKGIHRRALARDDKDELKGEPTEGPSQIPADKAAAKATTGSEEEGSAEERKWRWRIRFFPDGSATDATLVVTEKDFRHVRVVVIGISGEVIFSEIEPPPERKESEELQPLAARESPP